jgi:hypothetical protein
MNTITNSKTRYVYRYIDRRQTLEEALAVVFKRAKSATGHWPTAVIVPKIELDQLRTDMNLVKSELAKQGKILPDIALIGNGGTLVGEVWWEQRGEG